MFENLIEILKANPRKIVYTEGSDARILESAARLKKDGFLTPVLVGNVDEVKAAAAKGGFAALPEQLRRYEGVESKVYHPIAENVAVYRELFALYNELYAHFGKGSDLMKKLKKLRVDAAQ